MYIFTMDCGIYGCIVVIAADEAEARMRMAVEHNYSATTPVEKHEIKDGFLFANYGDM